MSEAPANPEPRTYLATEADEASYRQFLQVLSAAPETPANRPALVAADGTEVPLPRELHDVLLQVVQALRAGMGVNVAPLSATLTTQEAADYLGISRPTLVRLLDAGAIPMTRPGRHRYVRLVDLIEYSAKTRQVRADALDEMAQDADRADLYEGLDTPPPSMR